MRKIICGTDFSSSAREAADVAAALAVRSGAELTLLHAIPPWEGELMEGTALELIRGERRRALISEAARLRATGARVRADLVLGAASAMLVSAAIRSRAELIVVASVGDRSALRWVSGSVSLRAAQKATVPTLVVRDADRLKAWAAGERPLRVFVCYDFSRTSASALRWINALREWGPCDLTISHVAWPSYASWRVGATRLSSAAGNEPDAGSVSAVERDIRAGCEEVLGPVDARIKVVSSWGRPDIHLNMLAREGDADLIVVGSNQRNVVDRCWMGSVSRGVIRHSRMNVACVPGAYAPRLESSVIDEPAHPAEMAESTEYAEMAR